MVRRADVWCWILLLAAVLHGGAGWARAEDRPSLEVQLERGRIFLGQSVVYAVAVNNVDNATRPRLDFPKELQVEPRGESTRNQITIINGRRRENRGTVYQYLVTPQVTGRFTLVAPTIEVNGNSYTAASLELEVVAPESQDLVRLELETDREQVYPAQPFTVTLRVLVKHLPEPLSDRDPIQVLRSPPRLWIPWADDDELAEGLEPAEPWQEWLGPWQGRGGSGFRINGIRSAGMFSLLDDPGIGFLPPPQRVEREDAAGQPASYWQYEFPREFVADRVGEYRFGPVRLEGSVVSRVLGGRQAQVEEVYAFVRPLSVRVQEVPEAGRPASFINAAGRFAVRAELAPTEARLGDPITLTITLEGRGTLDTATPPDLEQVPEVRAKFRVYEATSDRDERRKQFIYSLRPLTTEIAAFPSIPVSYFDVEQGSYVTRHTEPLPLRVRPSERLDADQIRSADAASGGGSMEANEQGLRANETDPAAVRDQHVQPVRWLLAWSGTGGLFVLLLLVARQRRRWSVADPQRQQRQAAIAAREQLDRADACLASGDLREAADRIRLAVHGLIAIASERSEASLTADEVAVQLQAWKLDPDLVADTVSLLETCDAARYGGGQLPTHDLAIRARDVIERLVSEWKRRKWLP